MALGSCSAQFLETAGLDALQKFIEGRTFGESVFSGSALAAAEVAVNASYRAQGIDLQFADVVKALSDVKFGEAEAQNLFALTGDDDFKTKLSLWEIKCWLNAMGGIDATLDFDKGMVAIGYAFRHSRLLDDEVAKTFPGMARLRVLAEIAQKGQLTKYEADEKFKLDMEVGALLGRARSGSPLEEKLEAASEAKETLERVYRELLDPAAREFGNLEKIQGLRRKVENGDDNAKQRLIEEAEKVANDEQQKWLVTISRIGEGLGGSPDIEKLQALFTRHYKQPILIYVLRAVVAQQGTP